jgi:thioredoxin reductase
VANPQIEVRYHTQVTAIEGTEHIGAVHLRDEDGNVVREDTTGLFIFIGAKPRRISCRQSWRATTRVLC